MTLRSAPRRSSALVLIIALGVVPAGCSKSPTSPLTGVRVVPARSDIDDVAQLISTTVSADNGGWYFAIKAMAETLSVPPTALAAGEAEPASGRSATALSSRVGTLNAFTLRRAEITYNFRVGYVHPNNVITPKRDVTADHLEALVQSDGGSFLARNGIEGTYGFHAGQSFDSTFTVFNLIPSDANTMEFSGVVNDSAFALVHSTMAPSKGRLWFTDNFFDYSIRIPKNRLASNPYPISGAINWIIQAFPLNTPGRTDFNFDILIDARMTFDGTPNARFDLSDNLFNPTYLYAYTVNLNTGAIARLN